MTQWMMPKRKPMPEQLRLLTCLQRAKQSQYKTSQFAIPRMEVERFFVNSNHLTLDGEITGYWQVKFELEYVLEDRTFTELNVGVQVLRQLLVRGDKDKLTILWKD